MIDLVRSSQFSPQILNKLSNAGILAVVTIDKPEHTIPLVEALTQGGIKAIELAYRNGATLKCLQMIRQLAPELLVGIGTIITPEQMHQAQLAGAHFGVSPGYSKELTQVAIDINFPYAPGIMTPSEIQEAVTQGCRFLKYFPAQTVGELKHLRTMNAPFAHLGLQYLVMGGITERTAGAYMRDPLIAATGGSWIAPRELIASRSWDAIRVRAQAATKLMSDTSIASNVAGTES